VRRVRLYIRASWAWASLDREIAAGASLAESEARMLRAEQLLRPDERYGIAAVLRNILDAAEASSMTGGGFRADDAAILDVRDGLLQLIDLLRSDSPMTARAIALSELLACDSHGPLLSVHGAEPIAQALSEIASANTP
jgi:hypothetical protein